MRLKQEDYKMPSLGNSVGSYLKIQEKKLQDQKYRSTQRPKTRVQSSIFKKKKYRIGGM